MRWQQVKDKLKSHFSEHWPIWQYLSAYLILAEVVVINRWWQGEAFYFNHGLFDMALWRVAHDQAPLIDHFGPNLINQLSDHFSPTLYLLTPLYWLTDSDLVLVALKPILVVISAAIMYATTLKILAAVTFPTGAKKLGLVLAICFTWFIGLQNALIGDFAVEFVALVTMSGVLWSWEAKSWRWFWFWLILTLGVKESLVAFGAALGFYLLWQRDWRRGLGVFFLAIFYGLIIGKFLIPAFGEGYIYFARTEPLTLTNFLPRLIWPPLKIKTFFVSLSYFGGLPLMAGGAGLLLAQDFFVKFVFGEAPNWDLGLYYSLTTSLLLWWTSAVGLKNLLTNKWLAKFDPEKVVWAIMMGLIILGGLWSIKQRPPLLVAFNLDFYHHTRRMIFLGDFLRKIKELPPNELIMTQNNLAPYLIHGHQVCLLRDDYAFFEPGFIVLDLRAGQNPNNFWPATLTSRQFADQLLVDPNYEADFFTSEQVIFKRKK